MRAYFVCGATLRKAQGFHPRACGAIWDDTAGADQSIESVVPSGSGEIAVTRTPTGDCETGS